MRNNKLSYAIWAAFCRELSQHHGTRGYTTVELSNRFEIAPSTAWSWLKMLKEAECIFIVNWKRAGKNWVACYAWGFKMPDAPKPQRMTDLQYQQNYRRNKACRTSHAAPASRAPSAKWPPASPASAPTDAPDSASMPSAGRSA